MYAFLVNDGSLSSPSLADCVRFPSLHCEIGVVVFPWFWVAVYASTFLDCCRVVLATLGPRTTLSRLVELICVHLFVWGCHPVVFIFFTELWTACFTVGMQWLGFRLFRVGLEAGYA